MTTCKLAEIRPGTAAIPDWSLDPDTATITAIIADLAAVDRDGDTYAPGAFAGNDDVLISQWGHAAWQPGFLPVGRGAITEEGGLAIFRGTFLDTPAARHTFDTLHALGRLVGWSYGYDVVAKRPGVRGARRTLAGVTVLEVSPVLRPAGVGTATTATAGQLTDGTEEALRELCRAVAIGMGIDQRRELVEIQHSLAAA